MNANDQTLQKTREQMAYILSLFTFFHFPVLFALSYYFSPSWQIISATSAILSAVSVLSARFMPNSARPTVAICLTGQAALLTAAFAGHPWQTDTHMYFFAVVAMISAMVDITALLLATAVIAVHHLALNFLAPAFVYPGGSSLPRTLMHAVILLIEAGTLIAMTVKRLQLLTLSSEKQVLATEAEGRARAALADFERAQTQNDEVKTDLMAKVEREVNALVEQGLKGDFSQRIEARFDDETLNALTVSLNRLFSLLDQIFSTITHSVEGLASRDLTRRMEGEMGGRFDDIKQSLNRSLAALHDTMDEIRQVSVQSADKTGEISASAAQLAQENAGQTTEVERLTSTMEDLGQIFERNSQTLGQASSLAEELSDRTVSGTESVHNAVVAVGKIEESSNRINEIINVIESISFQTNLLALNAAVEAARAGESGKGFAVVASEVRTLAQRSSEAANDITTLIQETTSSVAEGVARVQETGEALTRITEALTDLASSIQSVVSADAEQKLGIGELRAVVSSMHSAIQKANRIAESNSAAAHGLQEGIGAMTTRIGAFRLSDHAPHAKRKSA